MLFRMAARRLSSLRGRLWSAEDPADERHRDYMRALETVHTAINEVGRAQGHLAAQLERIEGHVARVENRQFELQTRLRRTQALSARAYEASQAWPEKLAVARASDDYELPYEDPEPLISIPIPTYHSPDTLVDVALASVLAQSYENWEAIVVGDHCTDDTEQRLLAIGDSRIRWHNLLVRENDSEDPFERWAVKGTIPRATGMDMARGLWLAPLSHDDEWDADHLESLLGAARETHAEIVYSQMRTVDISTPEHRQLGPVGEWPPRAGQWHCQSAIFHAGLKFVRPDRRCALASEANDWNLARRAWEAGALFHFIERETSTLYVYPRWEMISEQYHELGLPLSAVAAP